MMLPGRIISWPGGSGPAPDIPQCGFRDLLCNEYDQDEGMTQDFMLTVDLFILCLALIFLLRFQYQSVNHYTTQISVDLIKTCVHVLIMIFHFIYLVLFLSQSLLKKLLINLSCQSE